MGVLLLEPLNDPAQAPLRDQKVIYLLGFTYKYAKVEFLSGISFRLGRLHANGFHSILGQRCCPLPRLWIICSPTKSTAVIPTTGFGTAFECAMNEDKIQPESS